MKAKGDKHHRYRAEEQDACMSAYQQAMKEPQAGREPVNIVLSPDSSVCSHPLYSSSTQQAGAFHSVAPNIWIP